MARRYSTGFRTGLLGAAGYKGTGIFDAFFIDIYSGSQPINADQAPTGTLLATLSESADGVTPLTFGTPANGEMNKAPAETWRGLGVAAGTPGWYRVRRAGDANDVSTTAVRMDGSIAAIGGDMKLGQTTVTVGVPVDINSFIVRLKSDGS